jgi:hypothetical protein
MDKNVILETVKFNLEAFEKGIITKEDFIQAVEEELNLKTI